MNFLYPSFLYGLFALALPIIVHLFNFQKYKVVYFSNFQFLQNLQMQTKRHSSIKRWILLLLRMLLITAIVFAFSHPYLKESNAKQVFATNTVCVFVDNSFTMKDKGDENLLINHAKSSAKQIANAFSPTDKFVLITNDLSAEQFRVISREDFISKVDEIKTNRTSCRFSELSLKVNDLFSTISQSNKRFFVISDFQKSAFDFDKTSIDTTIYVNLIHLPHASSNNIAVDSCWFEQPVFRGNQHLTLYVQVKNYSISSFENIPLTVSINNQEKATALCNLPSNSSVIVPLNFSATEVGMIKGEVQINDPGDIDFDDIFYFNFDIDSEVKVLEIYEKTSNKFLNSVFATDSIFHYSAQPLNNVRYDELAKYQLVILSQLSTIASGSVSEFDKYVKNGGSLVFVPSPISPLDNSVFTFLNTVFSLQLGSLTSSKTQIQYVNVQHSLFKNVFDGSISESEMPSILQYYPVSNKGGEFQELFKLQNLDCVFGVSRHGLGFVFVFGISLDESFGNFSNHPLIVPSFINMALSQEKHRRLYYRLNSNEIIKLRSAEFKGEQVPKMKAVNQNVEIVPQMITASGEIHLLEQNQLEFPGNFYITNSNEIIEGVAFNYPNMESNMSFYKLDDLKSLIKTGSYKNVSLFNYQQLSTNTAIQTSSFTSIFNWLILFALLLLMMEVAVVKFWR